MYFSRLVLALVPSLFLHTAAAAQTWIQSDRAEPFVPIASIPGIGAITPFTLAPEPGFTDATDEGFAANIPLGFTFNFLGTNATNIGVSSNGWIAFANGTLPSMLGNVAIGGSGTPNNIIAAWWDDLWLTAGSYGTIGAAPNRIFVLEYTDFGFFFGANDGGMIQIWIHEGPAARFEVRYGGVLSTTSYSATAGYEGANGTPNGTFRTCGALCVAADFNQMSNRAFRVEFPDRPELTADFGAFPRGATPGTQATGTLILINNGVQTATSVLTNVYLSTNNTLDASDRFIGSTTNNLPTGPTNVQITVAIPPTTPIGDYYLLAESDADGRYIEIIENDNVVDGPLFATGPDLSPIAIPASQPVSPGDLASFNVTVMQGGVPYSGPIDIRVFASIDQVFDQNDRTITTQTVVLNGATMQTVQVTGTFPMLAPGAYYAVAQLDPSLLIAETVEANNILVAAGTFNSGPDFSITSVSVPTAVSPGGVANITTTLGSVSVAYTGNVSYRLYASRDAVYDMGDTNLGTFMATFAGQASLPDTEMVTIPASLGAGRFFLIAWVDPTNAIPEVTDANNRGVSPAPMVVGPELGISAITFTPSIVEVGQNLMVQGTVRSTGVPHNGNVTVSIYVSADNIYDPGDDPLYQGTVFIPGLTSSAFNYTFAIPRTALNGDAVVPAVYNVFAVADPQDSIPEANDDDNFLRATGTLEIIGADLRVSSMSGDPVAFVGRPYTVTVTIENSGVAAARGFRRFYYLSEDAAIRIFDQQIAITDTATIPAGASQTFIDVVDIPALTSTATLYLGVIVDLYGTVPERNTNNNIGRIPVPLSIVFPIPNLLGEIVETATAAAAGEELAVTRLLRNDGVFDSGQFEYTYYLSTNPVISTDDVAIGTFLGDLPVGGDDYGIDVVVIPSEMPEGLYYVGLIIDPADGLDEVFEDDNTALGPQIPIYEAAIQFVTNTLPNATLGVQYEVGIYAVGGPLALTYSVSAGSLPNGLAIDPSSGIVSGLPIAEGPFQFTVRASAGSAYAERTYDIRVLAPTVELEIATPSLPTAIASRPYRARLVAAGGSPPYEWSAISRLPDGLMLSTSGELTGEPVTPGSLPITFRVRDAVGASESKDLALNVINANSSIEIVQVPLPTAIVGLPYCEPEMITLEAKNGIEPYLWSLIGTVPPGFTVSPEGAVCGTPEQAGRFPLTVRAQDQTGLFDTSLFILEVDDGTELAISTFSLEPAVAGTPYAQSVTAIRGMGPYTWDLVEGWGELPAGIELGGDGMLSGTPSAAGTYAFVVRVVDAQLRSDTQPLSIQVGANPGTKIDDEGCGCSSAESNDRPLASLAILALMSLVMVSLRKRWLLPAAVVLFGAGEANAQFVPGTPYVRTYAANAYVPCVNPTVLSMDVDDSTFPVSIPFQFKYYDQFPTSVAVGSNGALVFPSGTTIGLGNEAPGGGGTTNGFLAPMWDDLRLYSANTGRIGWLVSGTAPNRTLTICYENMSRFSYSGFLFNFQVRLFEGQSGRIEIDYGPFSGTAVFTASMGMEDQAGARPILFHSGGCTDSCTQTELASLSNMRLTLVQDPGIEIVAAAAIAPEIAFLGAQTPIQVQVLNLNVAAVGPFTVTVEAGDGPTVANPIVIGSLVVTLPGFSSQTVNVTSVFPASLGERSIYVAAVADSGGAVNEVNETNNRATSLTDARLLMGKADLAVAQVVTDVSAGVDAGGTLTVYTTITNVGGEPAAATPAAVMLSSNPVVSPQDVELGRFSVVLSPGESVTSTDTVTIPAATNSGIYYLGTYADPDNTLDELSESNNGRAYGTPVVVRGGSLAIVTGELPDGYVGEAYVALLTGVGGDGAYQWSVVQGTLPTGLGLVPGTGELFGRPQAAEMQSITIRLESAGMSVERDFTLMINDPAEPLTIVTRAVASGVVGQEYTFALVATGGADTSSLEWTATGLPMGLMMMDGVISGTPMSAGSSTVDLSVTNGSEMAMRQIELIVRDNANLLIVPAVLSTAMYGVPFEAQLVATGGVPPINWLKELGDLPQGVTLGIDGKLTGTPTEVGTFRFVVAARDSATGSLNATDINSFELEVLDVGGFSITTASLPDAVLGTGYDALVVAEGGLMPYEWSVSEGRLPDGIIANVTNGEFRLLGEPTKTGVANLLIEVVDSQQRRAIRALSIRTVDPILTTGREEGGCSCTAAERSDGSLLWLLLLGLVLLRQKSLGLALIPMLFAAEASAQLMPVPGTPYQRQTIPNMYTPLSNPTIIWNGVDDDSADVALPFDFRFYDEDVSGSITVGSNGAIVLLPGQFISLGNEAPGASSFTSQFIAPFWDDLLVNGYVGWQVDGTAPNRTLTIEWSDASLFSNSAFHTNFQVRLFEGRSARMQIDYGPTTGSGAPSASMGMEDQAGARPIFFHSSNCTTTCSFANVSSLANMRVDLVQDPGVEIVAFAIDAPEFAFLGAQTSVDVGVQNLHGTTLGPFTVEVLAGTGPTVQNPVSLGTFSITLSAFQQQTVQVPVVFPQSLGETSVHLQAFADSNNALAEVDENNNTLTAPDPTRLLRGRADLAPVAVTTDLRRIMASGMLTVYSTITNLGGEPTTNVPVAVILSSNPVISPQDLELARFTVSLEAGESFNATTSVSLAGLNGGTYYVGALADPERTLDELSESNNGLAAFNTITLNGGALSITTTDLPTSYVRQSYTALLSATGGSEPYSWEIVQGTLPMGIGLVPPTGELFGRPTNPEMQTFTVMVTSGSETDTATFTLVVSDPEEPLTIVTRAIPPAIVGQEYSFRLIATGGSATSSLAWSATGLPDGMSISSDGALLGSVDEADSSTITVTVTDGAETATRDLFFESSANLNLLIVPTLLSTAHYNEQYDTTLQSTGGIAPITWLMQLGSLPEGLDLMPDGTLGGVPTEVGLFRFVVEARDSGPGGLAAKDVNSFELVVIDAAGGFVISTVELPHAVIETGYDARIEASGGLPPYEWRIDDGRLPEGLVPTVDAETNEFRISGAPTTTGVTNLLVSAVDTQGRVARRAFALIIEDPPLIVGGDGDEEGCGCTTASQHRASLLGLVGLLGLIALRRSRR